MFGKLKSVGITKGDYCKVVTHSPTPLVELRYRLSEFHEHMTVLP